MLWWWWCGGGWAGRVCLCAVCGGVVGGWGGWFGWVCVVCGCVGVCVWCGVCVCGCVCNEVQWRPCRVTHPEVGLWKDPQCLVSLAETAGHQTSLREGGTLPPPGEGRTHTLRYTHTHTHIDSYIDALIKHPTIIPCLPSPSLSSPHSCHRESEDISVSV